MKTLKFTIIASAIFLSGCATPPPMVPAIEFNYRVENASASGVVQVFDMSGSTVVQIRNMEIRQPVFMSDDNAVIKHQVVGETAVLAGIHRSFSVLTGTSRAKVVRNGQTQASPLPPVVAGPIVSPAAKATSRPGETPTQPRQPGDDDFRTELMRLKDELTVLRSQLATANGADAGKVETSAKYARVTSSRTVSSVLVPFKDNSDEFDPKQALASTLLELARDSSTISVTGYTDSAKANPASSRLAKARALAASKYLVDRGIDKSKIKVTYKAAGGFIADNNTREGRDQNRRVEIEII